MRHGEFVLDQQLCFALHAASRGHGLLPAAPGRDRPDLQPSQYAVMLVLWEHERLGLSTIGEQLQMDSGTLSPLVRRLEAAGFVTRERDTVGERVVHVAVTEAGSALRDAAALARARWSTRPAWRRRSCGPCATHCTS